MGKARRARLRLVNDDDSEPRGGAVQRVDRRPAATVEERRAARIGEKPVVRGLVAHALRCKPGRDLRGALSQALRQFSIGSGARDAPQIGQKFIGAIGVRNEPFGRIVHDAEIAGMARIAALHPPRRAVDEHDRRARPPRRDRRAKPRDPAADDERVARRRKCFGAALPPAGARSRLERHAGLARASAKTSCTSSGAA